MWSDRTIKKLARSDSSAEDIVLMICGAPPAPGNPGDGGKPEALKQLEGECDELDKKHLAAEDVKVYHPSPRILAIWLGVLAPTEVFGCLLVMKSIGLENPERAVLAATLAAFIFVITSAVKRPRSNDKEEKNEKQWGSKALLVAYGLFILALTLARVNQLVEEEEYGLGAWVTAIVMIPTTIGPALLWDYLFPQWREAKKAYFEEKRLRKRKELKYGDLAHSQRGYSKACSEAADWEKEAEVVRAKVRVYRAVAQEKEKEEAKKRKEKKKKDSEPRKFPFAIWPKGTS